MTTTMSPGTVSHLSPTVHSFDVITRAEPTSQSKKPTGQIGAGKISPAIASSAMAITSSRCWRQASATAAAKPLVTSVGWMSWRRRWRAVVIRAGIGTAARCCAPEAGATSVAAPPAGPWPATAPPNPEGPAARSGPPDPLAAGCTDAGPPTGAGPAPAVAGRAGAGPAVAGPAAAGPAVPGPAVPGLAGAGPAAGDPAGAGPKAAPAAPVPAPAVP